jgi:hypothetical protein
LCNVLGISKLHQEKINLCIELNFTPKTKGFRMEYIGTMNTHTKYRYSLH